MGGREREEGNPLTPQQVRAGMGHRNPGQRRTKGERDKGSYRGELERTGRHRIYELRRQVYQGLENATGGKTKTILGPGGRDEQGPLTC